MELGLRPKKSSNRTVVKMPSARCNLDPPARLNAHRVQPPDAPWVAERLRNTSSGVHEMARSLLLTAS